MNKIILMVIMIMCVCCYSCITQEKEDIKNLNQPAEIESKNYEIVIVDSCEYVTSIYATSKFIHKGNCKFCAERQKKRDKEFLNQLKSLK